MNLMRKPPLGLKEPKAKPDPAHLARILSYDPETGVAVQEFGSDRDYIAATLDKLGV